MPDEEVKIVRTDPGNRFTESLDRLDFLGKAADDPRNELAMQEGGILRKLIERGIAILRRHLEEIGEPTDILDEYRAAVFAGRPDKLPRC